MAKETMLELFEVEVEGSEEKKIEFTSVAAPDGMSSRIISAFYAERDSFQKDVEKQAKAYHVDTFAYYSALLFEKSLEARWEYAKSRQTKVLQGAIGVLVAQGKTITEAKKMLGLGE